MSSRVDYRTLLAAGKGSNDMAMYRCWGCDTLKDDDYSPMGNLSLCDECHIILQGWTITYNPKPIPTRSMDWDFISDEYDGENGLCGTAPSLVNAIEQIMEIEYELAN